MRATGFASQPSGLPLQFYKCKHICKRQSGVDNCAGTPCHLNRFLVASTSASSVTTSQPFSTTHTTNGFRALICICLPATTPFLEPASPSVACTSRLLEAFVRTAGVKPPQHHTTCCLAGGNSKWGCFGLSIVSRTDSRSYVSPLPPVATLDWLGGRDCLPALLFGMNYHHFCCLSCLGVIGGLLLGSAICTERGAN